MLELRRPIRQTMLIKVWCLLPLIHVVSHYLNKKVGKAFIGIGSHMHLASPWTALMGNLSRLWVGPSKAMVHGLSELKLHVQLSVDAPTHHLALVTSSLCRMAIVVDMRARCHLVILLLLIPFSALLA